MDPALVSHAPGERCGQADDSARTWDIASCVVTEEPDQSRAKRISSMMLALALLCGVVYGFGLAFDHFLMPKRAPRFYHPSAIDSIIASRLTVGVIRLVGILVSVYIVASLTVLVFDSRWAVGFGPLATEHRKREDREQLQARLKEAEERADAVEREYAEMAGLLQQLAESVPDFDEPDESDIGGGVE